MPDQARVPQGLEGTLTMLGAALSQQLGESLVSLILYGEAANSASWQPDGVANLLVVADRVDVDLLDQLAEPLREARRQVHLGVMVLTEAELRSSCDVFPTKFLNMREHHTVLCGSDPLADLVIARDHLRLRCEQEVKNILLRLRQAYLGRAHRGELLVRTLHETAAALVATLAAVAALGSGQEAPTREAVMAQLEQDLGLSLAPVREALAAYDLEPAALTALFGQFMDTVRQLADRIDRL